MRVFRRREKRRVDDVARLLLVLERLASETTRSRTEPVGRVSPGVRR
jgi:hypothetical protein